MYKSEEALVKRFVDTLRLSASPWGPVSIGREFQYDGGRTDVIAVSETGHLLAFEAKLRQWREALIQAYRATFFADRSYVLLPEHPALLAHSHVGEFVQRGVGLCYVASDRVVVLYDAKAQQPMQTWLRRAAVSMIEEHGNGCSKPRRHRKGVLREAQS